MAPKGEQSKSAAERRRPRERRALKPNPEGTNTVLRVLAKLLAMLTGFFAGLIMAYFVSFLFVARQEALIVQAEQTIEDTQAAITELEPEFQKAETQYRRIRLDQEAAATKSQAQSDGTSNSVPGLGPVPDGPTDIGVSAAERKAIDETYKRVNNRMDSLKSTLKTWQTERADYQHTIFVLNLLSLAVVLIMMVLGFLLDGFYYRRLQASSEQWTAMFAQRSLRTGPLLVGFFAGLVLAVLVLLALFTTIRTEYGILALAPFRLVFGAFIAIVFGMIGALIGASYFSPPPPEKDPYEDFRRPAAPNLLDSSVLIDGRVYEVAVNGFLQGTLVVPSSVLMELQTLADSADERKRLKGRRGLDMVNKLKGDSRLDCMVLDDSSFDWQARGADEHLIAVAKDMGANVVTNDSNLNRVASARDVRVINLHALANAVKTNMLPGDFIELDITDRGKQRGQGVGYLPDGTMVVVEDGEPYIGMVKTIKLTSISQTQAGRLLFGRVDLAEGRGGDGNGHNGNGGGGGR